MLNYRFKLMISFVFLSGCWHSIAGENSSHAHGSRLSIEWKEPEKYRDIRPSNESRKRFRARVLEELESYMHELVTALPASQNLSIVVTDVDLAGRVMPGSFTGFSRGMNDIRLIKDVDIPRINLTYQLFDADGKVIKKQDVKLKDMGFLQKSRFSLRNEFLKYEKVMLQAWFETTFIN